MTRDEAIDIIARKSVAMTAISTTGFLPERTYNGPDRKAIRQRMDEIAGLMNPSCEEYELAYDVIKHTREKL